jgi:hypothetical protein
MSVTRPTRLAMIAAAASGALVVTMAGTALATDRPTCADVHLQDAQAALDAVDLAERLRLEELCEAIPTLRSDDTGEADDAAPDTTPATAPDEESADW